VDLSGYMTAEGIQRVILHLDGNLCQLPVPAGRLMGHAVINENIVIEHHVMIVSWLLLMPAAMNLEETPVLEHLACTVTTINGQVEVPFLGADPQPDHGHP